MTRVATPENEEYLLMIARYGTAAQLEKLVRGYRTVKRLEARKIARRQREERSLQYFYEEDGTLVIRAKLPPEQGAVVLKALDAAVDTLRNDEPAVGGGFTLEGASERSDSAYMESPTLRLVGRYLKPVALCLSTTGTSPRPVRRCRSATG